VIADRLNKRVLAVRSLVDYRMGERIAYSNAKKDLEIVLKVYESDIIDYRQILAIFQSLSVSVQETFIRSIESLVSEGLAAVFEEPIQLRIESVIRGGQANLDFSLINEDGTETSLIDARGGGLISLCGILFRIVMLRLLSGRIRQLLILDEPLSHLSDEYIAPAGELLKKLSDDLSIQILMISHQTEFAEYADKAYKLVKKNGTIEVIETMF